MPSAITNYQCPACGGPLHFDAEQQKLKCDYCGSVFTNEEISAYYQEKNDQAIDVNTPEAQAEAAQVLQWTEEEARHMRAYSCPSCGAQLICDENTAATRCPYCDNPTIVPAQFDGALKPDYIIPFQLKKEQAIEKLREFYGGKPLLPSAFTQDNHIEEVKGIYVPFWLYDGTAKARMTYHGTTSHSYTSGDDMVTVTDHYRLIREGSVRFNHVPADASSKMPDEFMDALEPFDYRKMVPFEMEYLPGYLADKYDVSAEEDSQRADVRMRNTTIQSMRSTVAGYSVTPEQENVYIRPDKVQYAFFPVWMLTTRWKDKIYMFAMNGQSGKMIGDLPIDNGKFILYLVGITAGLMAILFLVFFVILGY
ncbi:MAG: hypothetical protein IKG46_07990 [Solobacterium sp.]|nr:hypothetical protein [Solobacterium sp.]